MSLFAKEFPTTVVLTQAAFTAEVIGWLRGGRGSRILAEATEQDLDGDAPLLRAASGETLAMLRLAGEADTFALGFRHDLPDAENRIWRTEGVLRRSDDVSNTILRIRGQCIAAASVAHLQPPRRPHLIRALLERGIGGRDGVLQIQTTPHLLRDTEDDQLLASDITEGKATRHPPVVYVSALSANRWIAGRDELNRLALDLAGVAHVVLEPRRELSFRVKELTNGRNAYGGTIGIAVRSLGLCAGCSLAGPCPTRWPCLKKFAPPRWIYAPIWVDKTDGTGWTCKRPRSGLTVNVTANGGRQKKAKNMAGRTGWQRRKNRGA